MPTGFDVETGSNLSPRLAMIVNKVAEYLKSRRDQGAITPEHPTPATAMAEWIHRHLIVKVNDTDIRAMVNYLRRNKKPVASVAGGYFWAVNHRELEPTMKHMAERINGIQAAYEGLRNCQFEDPRLF